MLELDPYACSKTSDYVVDEFSEYPPDTPTAKLKGLVEPFFVLFKINIQRKKGWYDIAETLDYGFGFHSAQLTS